MPKADHLSLDDLSRDLDRELGLLLALPKVNRPKLDLSSLTRDLSIDDLCELATECEDCSVPGVVSAVQARIEGVLGRCGDQLDDAAKATLLAVAYVLVPHLQDAVESK